MRQWLLFLFTCLFLSDCFIHEKTYPVVSPNGTVEEEIIYAPLPPPRSLLEIIPIPPGIGYIWCQGYWFWSGYRYDWIIGRYILIIPGMVWIQPHYYYNGSLLIYVRGHWDALGTVHL